MFFHIQLQRTVVLQPRYFGPNVRNTLIERLYAEVEGTCSGRYGYVITVTNVTDVGLGKIQDATGAAQFLVSFKAIVFRPFKGEVLDAVVISVTKFGFMAEVGPLQIFVSTHCMHPDMKFDAEANPPCFISEDETVKIKKDDEVRLKITGMRASAAEMFCVGTIREDYLGLLS